MVNKLLVLLFTFLCLCFSATMFSQTLDTINARVKDNEIKQEFILSDGRILEYKKTKLLDIITKIPKDFISTNKDFIAHDHPWYLGGALAATAILIPVDQQITNQTIKWADGINLNRSNKYTTFGPLQNIPENIGGALYLIGNGTTVILLSAGFTTYGLLANDYRAQATASGLIESLAVSGIFVQTLKRITGRESPFIARENNNPGGNWHFFPSFKAYAQNTPFYDAMPSGHLTTIMAGLTVITTNYPDIKWIKPVGYTLLAGMCYQMIQSEVHWMSDYPIAILIGYFIGKNIARNRFTEKQTGIKPRYAYHFTTTRNYGTTMLGINIKF